MSRHASSKSHSETGMLTAQGEYRKPRSISDSKKPKDTFIGAYTLEKYEGSSRKKLMVSASSNPKVSA